MFVQNQNRKGNLAARFTYVILVGYSPGNLYCVLITTDSGIRDVVSNDDSFDELGADSAPTSASSSHEGT